MNETDIRNEEVQTTTQTGAPVRRRLSSHKAAWDMFVRLRDEDEQGDARRRAKLQNMINGAPPYNPAELRSKGLAHKCNVNFMAMRANLDERAAAAHELFVEVPTLVELKPRSSLQDNPDVYHYCSIIAEEFSEMVLDWDGFLPAMDLAVRESDAFGIGYVLFPDRWDWRFKPGRRSKLLFSPRARVEIDENDFIMVRDEMRAGELFEAIEDEETATNSGWNVGAVRMVLVNIFREGEYQGDTTYQASTWESVAHMQRNNDPYYQKKETETVKVVHQFTREVYGEQKISHYIMAESTNCKQFLFTEHDVYTTMGEGLWWLPYNFGDGYARSVRGVASLMAPHDDLSNRFLGDVFDLGFLSSKLLLQPSTPGDLGKISFTQVGPYAILPVGLNAVQTSFRPQISPLIELRNLSEKIMMNNTGLYKKHNESFEREAAKTARQVMEETSKEARYEKAAVAHRYTHLDKLYREMFRRVVAVFEASDDVKYSGYKQARDFIKRCEERGVERKFMKGIMENVRISATRALGMGSTGVKFDITNQLINAAGMFDEVGKREALRDWTAARVGYRNVAKYVARIDRDQAASDATSLAMLEWNDVTEGHQVVAGSDQLHKAHIAVFMQGIAQLIQAHEQGQVQDYATAHRTVAMGLDHITQHAQFIAQDVRYKQFIEQVKQFAKVAQQALGQFEQIARQQARAMQQQQQDQQRVLAEADQVKRDREIELKVFEAQRRFELEMMKQQSLNDARRIKTAEQQQINREKAAESTRLQAERQAAEIEIARRKADADIAVKQAKAAG